MLKKLGKNYWVRIYAHSQSFVEKRHFCGLCKKKEKKCYINTSDFLKPEDSHFWAGLMATKKYFFPYCSVIIKDGSEIRFWDDKWLLGTIARHKGDTLATKVILYTTLHVTNVILSPRYWSLLH
jgi:hypothetical protein